MRNNPFLFTLMFSLFILAIDIYSYQGVRKLIANSPKKVRKIVFGLFWIVPLILVLGLIIFSISYSAIPPSRVLTYFHFISGTFILFYVPKLVFIIFILLENIYLYLKSKLFRTKVQEEPEPVAGNPISRAQFLTRVGIVMAGIPFISIAYGIKWGRFNFTVRNHTLKFPGLPAAFDGIRLLQFSDFHIGSFLNNPHKVEEAIHFMNEQKADLILFTGDFVNNVASEMDNFVSMLNQLKATEGKFSILGNHDYGDYYPWKSYAERRQNLETLIKTQEDLGLKMLLNDSFKIERDGAEIELVGVENWGLPPFPQYGDLDKALSKVNPTAFKILLSHDPTHWDEQVLHQTNIDLTLSGHTHGAQFGIEIPGWRWSPVSIRYKRWGGMYKEGAQYLNVNTGIGFIGYPGRVGIPPEITVIELKRE
jgi:predicted MPP superfamily phosphohydrolase